METLADQLVGVPAQTVCQLKEPVISSSLSSVSYLACSSTRIRSLGLPTVKQPLSKAHPTFH